MKSLPKIICCTGLLALAIGSGGLVLAAEPTDPALLPWQSPKIQPVVVAPERHVIHSYFNTSPESPDGKYVLYFTSPERAGENGDLRILERATHQETIIASNVACEDAHRAACQQWSNGGQTVLYHNVVNGRWRVLAVDVATKAERVLAEDRQLAFGSPVGKWAPIYGCHWNPGSHRNIELVQVVTGEIRTAVTVDEVVREHGKWIEKQFGDTEISLFFPIVTRDEKRVFFKLSRPSGGSDYKSKQASKRQGLVAYDLEQKKLIFLRETWGHPSWSPDGKSLFEVGNQTIAIPGGSGRRHAPSCFSDHPSLSPAGGVFVTDADVSKRPFGKPGLWGVAVGSLQRDEFVILKLFDNTQGAKSWRHNHPHPAFSADGQRVYFNVNDGPWTRLLVAEAAAVAPNTPK